jgi:quinol monooxygenase YgiN
MIVEYIRYRIPADRAEGFEAAYGRAARSLAAAPECGEYELTRCVDEPDQYILRITWTSAKGHLESFRGGKHFPPFFAEIKPYVGDILEMRHYEKTAVRGEGGAVPSLYEWLGGEEALQRLTEAFYREVLKDELLYPLFAGMDPEHPKHVAVSRRSSGAAGSAS